MHFLNGWRGFTLFLVLGLFLGMGGTSSYLFFSGHDAIINTSCLKDFPLTSNLLDCGTYDDSSARMQALDGQLDAAVALYIKEGKATRASVWVRDLTSLQWASTNETERYAPASLLKLPLMIAYFKVAEIEPTVLTAQLVYTPSSVLNDNTQDFESATKLVPGQSYSVNDLINYMIVDSDNNATAMLIQHLDPAIFENTLIDLGIKIPGNSQDYDFVTVKSYGAIFRTLYNASYLDRTSSQKALALLAQEAFKGIATPIPAGVTVAHKFGEREMDNPDGSVQTRELHDCGIVYKANRPYTICIMTEGSSFDDLQTVITDLSSVAYQQL